jgi:hypothetical protein
MPKDLLASPSFPYVCSISEGQKRRPEGGEWESQFFSRNFRPLSQSYPKQKQVDETKILKPTGDKST